MEEQDDPGDLEPFRGPGARRVGVRTDAQEGEDDEGDGEAKGEGDEGEGEAGGDGDGLVVDSHFRLSFALSRTWILLSCFVGLLAGKLDEDE